MDASRNAGSDATGSRGARSLALVTVLLGSSCGGAPERPPAPPASAAASPSASVAPAAPGPVAVGAIAPPFRIQAADGATLDSADWIGKRPFVVVFFMTWCPVCARKVQIVKEVLDEAGGDVRVIGVALDEADTWSDAPAYAAKHGLRMTLVHGEEQPGFTRSYDPPADPKPTFPAVVVVGRDGRVVEVQPGLAPGQKAKLADAIARAK